MSARPIPFTERALRLAPRALSADRADEGARIVLHGHRMTAAERGEVEHLAQRVARAPWHGESPGEDWQLTCAWRVLDQAAGDLARLLRHTLDVAARRPLRSRMMGIVNVTPDSFSDGGRYVDPARAVERALVLESEGAEVIDIGGESTRPGAEPVPAEIQLERVLPVIRELDRRMERAVISVDTTLASVARACLDAGASIVNDVSAGRFDAEMLPLVAERRSGYVAMHMQGTPRDMQSAPRYRDVTSDVLEFLRERVVACLEQGIEPERIWIDPGFGFGKTLEHNVALLRRLPELGSLGLPVCVGVSRKSFLARLAPGDEDRRAATAVAVGWAVVGGAEILRVHDVAAMKAAAAVASALSHRENP